MQRPSGLRGLDRPTTPVELASCGYAAEAGGRGHGCAVWGAAIGCAPEDDSRSTPQQALTR